MIDCVEAIKSSVSMRDVAARYGLPINSMSKTKCPFHNDSRPSMHVYGGKRGYYCFVCNKGGDVIDFVQNFFNLSFRDAIKKLNDDFKLNLPVDSALDEKERIEAEKMVIQRKAEQKRKEMEMKRLTTIYHAAFDRWKALDDIKRDQAPKTPLDEPSEDYIYACKHIDQAWEAYVEAERNVRGMR